MPVPDRCELLINQLQLQFPKLRENYAGKSDVKAKTLFSLILLHFDRAVDKVPVQYPPVIPKFFNNIPINP